MPTLDLAPLVPDARPIVAAATNVFMSQARPWFIGLLVHGSALKGGVIPGCSDIDFQLYLQDEAFSAGQLHLETALAIQRGLSIIDVAPFQYIQCWARPGRLNSQDKSAIGPIPGTYHVLAGTLPVPEATLEDAVVRAWAALDADRAYLSNDLLQHGGGRLERTARYACTDVWPVLFSLLLLQERDLRVWRLTKLEAIATLPEPLRSAANEFLRRVYHYYGDASDVSRALALIEQGAATISLAREIAQADREPPSIP